MLIKARHEFYAEPVESSPHSGHLCCILILSLPPSFTPRCPKWSLPLRYFD